MMGKFLYLYYYKYAIKNLVKFKENRGFCYGRVSNGTRSIKND